MASLEKINRELKLFMVALFDVLNNVVMHPKFPSFRALKKNRKALELTSRRNSWNYVAHIKNNTKFIAHVHWF